MASWVGHFTKVVPILEFIRNIHFLKILPAKSKCQAKFNHNFMIVNKKHVFSVCTLSDLCVSVFTIASIVASCTSVHVSWKTDATVSDTVSLLICSFADDLSHLYVWLESQRKQIRWVHMLVVLLIPTKYILK